MTSANRMNNDDHPTISDPILLPVMFTAEVVRKALRRPPASPSVVRVRILNHKSIDVTHRRGPRYVDLPALQLIRISEQRSGRLRATRGRWIKDYAIGADARAPSVPLFPKSARSMQRGVGAAIAGSGNSRRGVAREAQFRYSVLAQSHGVASPIMNGSSCARIMVRVIPASIQNIECRG